MAVPVERRELFFLYFVPPKEHRDNVSEVEARLLTCPLTSLRANYFLRRIIFADDLDELLGEEGLGPLDVGGGGNLSLWRSIAQLAIDNLL